MKTIGELAFEYIWLMTFGAEDVIDLNYSCKMQETLPSYFSSLTDQEKKFFQRSP